jgi:hypothetical protein
MQTALLIFIVVFALAIGFFLGLFLLSLDVPFLKKLFQKEDADDTNPASSAAIGDGTSFDPAQEVKKPSPDSQLLLKVWKAEGKPPVYEFGGVYVDKEKLPRELLNVITVHEGSPPQGKPQPAPQPQPLPEIPQEKKAPEVSSEPEEEEEGEVKMLSVVDEVNEILQRKLHGSPMAGKGIHLMENYNKEIRFWVGLESYNDVAEIPDPEIRRLINEAVKEWEQNRT